MSPLAAASPTTRPRSFQPTPSPWGPWWPVTRPIAPAHWWPNHHGLGSHRVGV